MKAFFVYHPRTYRDLIKPHLLSAEQEYEIVRVVELEQIDYENFTEDMLADRPFIENSITGNNENGTLRCLLVKERDSTEGILVVPEMGAYVRKAAFNTLRNE